MLFRNVGDGVEHMTDSGELPLIVNARAPSRGDSEPRAGHYGRFAIAHAFDEARGGALGGEPRAADEEHCRLRLPPSPARRRSLLRRGARVINLVQKEHQPNAQRGPHLTKIAGTLPEPRGRPEEISVGEGGSARHGGTLACEVLDQSPG